MDVEAVTDEIPSYALSCSPLIDFSNLQEECWEFSIHVEAVQTKGRQNLWNPSINWNKQISTSLEEVES